MQIAQSANYMLLAATCFAGLLSVALICPSPASAQSGDDSSIESETSKATIDPDTSSDAVAVLPSVLHEVETQQIAALSTSNFWYTLPARGGGGGGPGTLSCASGDVAVGVYGRAGAYIDQLGLTCARLMDDGSLGPMYDTGSLGGLGGGAFRLSCPFGQAIVGFHGGSGDLLDRVGLYCAGVGSWRTTGNVEYTTGAAGGGGGLGFADLCPSDYVAARINLRTGLYVDREELLCVYIYP